MTEELLNAQKLLQEERAKRVADCEQKLREFMEFIEANQCRIDFQQLWKNGQPGPLQAVINAQ